MSIEPPVPVTYHPLPTRSPGLRDRVGRDAVVVRVADDDTGRAMLLFPDLALIAAIPDEIAPAGEW